MTGVEGVELFSNPDKDKQKLLILIVEPLKKVITTLRVNFVSYW